MHELLNRKNRKEVHAAEAARLQSAAASPGDTPAATEEEEIEKAVSVERTTPEMIGGMDDEDIKTVANEVAELWASLYGSALDAPKQAISETRLSLSMKQIEALRDRRKRVVINDAPLPATKVYLVTNEGKAYGILSLASPLELSVEEFMAEEMKDEDLASEGEREQRWPDANRLFSHGVLAYFDFGEPVDPDQVEYKMISKMTREDLIRMAGLIDEEARKRSLEIGLPNDLVRQFRVAKEENEPQPQDLKMAVEGFPEGQRPQVPEQPKEYASNRKKLSDTNQPIDGPKGHEWGSTNPAQQQEWDAGDYSHHGEGDAGGFYEFSLNGGARYVPGDASGTNGTITSGTLSEAGKRNPVIARWRTRLTKAVVVPTVRMLLEARIHEAFTVTADHMLALGLLDREERIAISGLIGEMLDKFGGELPYDLGSRPLNSVPEAEAQVIDKEAPSPKIPPDIIMEAPGPNPPGPASSSPDWGPVAPAPAKKEAQFIVGEPPGAPTAPDVRGGHFPKGLRSVDEDVMKASGDEFMVAQKEGEKYPFVLQHHFRGIWTLKERTEFKTGLQKVRDILKKDEVAADQLLSKLWHEYKPAILTTSMEKFSSMLQEAADKNGEVSSVARKNLDSSVPKAIDLQKVFANIVNPGNVHTDFRVRSPGGEWLIGWTMDTPGIVLQRLDGKLLRVMRNKVLENQPGDRVLCQKKGRMGVGWLHLVSPGKSIFRVEPGEAGATKNTAGEFRYLDEGEAVFGAQKPDYHEMFLFFSKNRQLNGRWEVRGIDEKPTNGGSEKYWLLDRPKSQTPYVIDHRDEPQEAGQVIRNEGAVDVLRAAGYPGLKEETVSKYVPIFKDAAEERTVFGIVLEPETMDAHGDIISVEEIRNAAYGYMEFFQQKGFQHGKNPRYPAFPEGLRLLESYILDPSLFPNGVDFGSHHIKPGTWLMRMRVDHDGLWEDVKSGRVTGFSIGGFARSVTEEKAA